MKLALSCAATLIVAALAMFQGGQVVVGNYPVQYVNSAPSGSCSQNAPLQLVVPGGTLYSCQSGTWAQISGAGGGVTNVATTSPLSGGPITTTGTLSCPTCAIGPGSSTASHVAIFSGTDGLTLADAGATLTSAAPIFSTAVTGLSMATAGTNTVITGPTTMTTPGAAGTYRVIFQVIQTVVGSGGTCTAGTVGVSLSYKDADTGVTYSLVAAGPNIAFSEIINTAPLSALQMTTALNAGSNFTSTPREFRAASGTAIQYEVAQQTNSNCTVAPVFAVRPALYATGY